MQTEIISPVTETDIEHAAGLIRRGQLVAFPTETVYGLGANGLDASACARIYKAKGRPADNPLILHISDLSMAADVAREVPPAAAHLLTVFAPGPLTVIVPKAAHIPDIVTGGLPTVGVRCPANDIARALIRAAGVPVAAVGLGRPEVFADGAAIGTPAARMRRRATSWSGQRTPTVGSPPVTISGMCAAFGRMTVRGPGANTVRRCAAVGGTSAATSCAIARAAIWRMSGLSEGRPFAA